MSALSRPEVTIESATRADLQTLSSIYKESFTAHNIFQKSRVEVLRYLQETQQKQSKIGGGFLVAMVRKKVIGGILLKNESEEGQHQRWKFNHLAVNLPYRRQRVGTTLLNAAEQKIQAQLQKGMTAKIELHVHAPGKEKELVGFYQRFSFVLEGKLASHYRRGEMVYALGKEIRRPSGEKKQP